MSGMKFVGGYPNEYCIFMDTLSDDEQKEIRKQLNSSWIKFCWTIVNTYVHIS